MPGLGAFPALLGLFTLPLPLGWFAEPESNVLSLATWGLEEMPFRARYFQRVTFRTVSPTLADSTLAMLRLTVGTVCEVDPQLIPLPRFAILKSKKRVVQRWEKEHNAAIEPAVYEPCFQTCGLSSVDHMEEKNPLV